MELGKALGANAAQYLVSDFAHCRLRDVAVDLERFERLAARGHLPSSYSAESAIALLHKSLVLNPSYGCAHSS